MTTRKRWYWSNEEVEYLLDQVSKSPQNLQSAFQKTAKKINRSTSTVSQKYYNMKRQGKIQKTCFTLISDKVNMKNGKNSRMGTYYHLQNTPSNIWKKILSLFK